MRESAPLSCAPPGVAIRTAAAVRARRRLFPSRDGRLGAWASRVQAAVGAVDVAPCPGVARRDRPHDRVSGVLEMRGRVFSRRRIAAADVATGPAFAKL